MKNWQVASFRLFVILIFFLIRIFITPQVSAQSSTEVNVYLFWGEGCPHCAKAKPFLEQLVKENPKIHLLAYEIYNNDDNLELMKQVALGFGFTPTKVPTIFIGDQYWEGYSDTIETEIRDAIETNLTNGSTDKVASILAGKSKPTDQKLEISPLVIVLAGVMAAIVLYSLLRNSKFKTTKKKYANRASGKS